MDVSHEIWIAEALNYSTPDFKCDSMAACSNSIAGVAGKAYQIYIKATNSLSGIIDISNFEITGPHTIYHESTVESRDFNWCGICIGYNLNKQYNGVHYCPLNVYKCNLMDPENRYTSSLIPNYCLTYTWSSNVFLCSTCATNARIEDNLCVCNPGFAQNHAGGACISSGYQLEINLYRVTYIQTSTITLDFDIAFLIVSNPCTQEYNNFFCKETGASNLLYEAIISEFIIKDSFTYSASAYLTEGSYSITINYLKAGGLMRECWNSLDYNRYRDTSGIANFIIPSGAWACVWEGFLKAPEYDIDIFNIADDFTYLWLEDYSNILWINYLSTQTLSLNLIKDKFYYIKLFFYAAGGNTSFDFKWRKTGTITYNPFTSDMLYFPTRPSWNIFHSTSLNDKFTISSNDIDSSLYYCPYECSSCDVSLNGKFECKGCREDMILQNGECVCHTGYTAVSISNSIKCIECPANCESCEEFDGEILCNSCSNGYNLALAREKCECDPEDFYVQGNTCIVKPFEVYLTSEYNCILIHFSKDLLEYLTKDEFAVIFDEKLDTRLIFYDLYTVRELREYIVEFSFHMNIHHDLPVALAFSDKVADKQDQKLILKTVDTFLTLFYDDFEGRSEFCPESCKECEFMNGRCVCSVCYDYAFLIEGDCKCYMEESTDPKVCPNKCPEDMKVDPDLKTCLQFEDSSEIEVDNSAKDEESKEIGITKEESEIISSVITATTSAVSVGSLLYLDKLWSLMSTIQIYTYLPLLQVDMPLYVRKNLKSQDSIKELLNNYRDEFKAGLKPFSKAKDFGYATAYLPYNCIKPLTVYLVILSLNILTYAAYKLLKGKAKQYAESALKLFRYKIYIRSFIQLYLDIIVPSFLQLAYVIFI